MAAPVTPGALNLTPMFIVAKSWESKILVCFTLFGHFAWPRTQNQIPASQKLPKLSSRGIQINCPIWRILGFDFGLGARFLLCLAKICRFCKSWPNFCTNTASWANLRQIEQNLAPRPKIIPGMRQIGQLISLYLSGRELWKFLRRGNLIPELSWPGKVAEERLKNTSAFQDFFL